MGSSLVAIILNSVPQNEKNSMGYIHVQSHLLVAALHSMFCVLLNISVLHIIHHYCLPADVCSAL